MPFISRSTDYFADLKNLDVLKVISNGLSNVAPQNKVALLSFIPMRS